MTPPINSNNVFAAILFDADSDKTACDGDTSYSWVVSYNEIKFITKQNLGGVGWIAICV